MGRGGPETSEAIRGGGDIDHGMPREGVGSERTGGKSDGGKGWPERRKYQRDRYKYGAIYDSLMYS